MFSIHTQNIFGKKSVSNPSFITLVLLTWRASLLPSGDARGVNGIRLVYLVIIILNPFPACFSTLTSSSSSSSSFTSVFTTPFSLSSITAPVPVRPRIHYPLSIHVFITLNPSSDSLRHFPLLHLRLHPPPPSVPSDICITFRRDPPSHYT